MTTTFHLAVDNNVEHQHLFIAIFFSITS